MKKSLLFLSSFIFIFLLVPQKALAECTGHSTVKAAVSQPMTLGYNYWFETVGTTVTVTVEFLDIQGGTMGYIQTYNPAFVEVGVGPIGVQKYSQSFPGQTTGATFKWAGKMAYMGGLYVTQTFTNIVGDNCSNVLLTASNNGETICIGNPITLTATPSIPGVNYTWYKKESGDLLFTQFDITAANTMILLPTISTEYKVEYGGEESIVINVQAMVCCSQSTSKTILFQENFGTLPANCDRTSSATVPPAVGPTYQPAGFILDGFYAVVANPGCTVFGNNAGVPYYVTGEDHTPSDVNGGMLFLNNGAAATTSFRKTIKNPCQNTTIEFGAWFSNVCRVEAFCDVPANLTFKIYGKIGVGAYVEIPNSSIKTGNLNWIGSMQWNERKTTFNSSNYDSLRVEIINNAPGGNGNDVVIDDITLSACAPRVNLFTNGTSFKSDTLVCNNQIITLTPLAGYDLTTYFASPNYLLQYSNDSITWNNILPVVNSINPTFTANTATLTSDTTFYRVIVGNTEATVLAVAGGTYIGGDCLLYTITNIARIFKFSSISDLSIEVQDTKACEGDQITLNATSVVGVNYKWEYSDNGGTTWQLIPTTTSSITDNATLNRMYKVSVENTCITDSASITFDVSLPITDLVLEIDKLKFAPGETATLNALSTQPADSYLWSDNNETTTNNQHTITLYKDKTYTVTATSGGCPSATYSIDVQVTWSSAITPYEKDGLNDVFLPNTDLKMFVFNRYGQKVYEGTTGWNGIYRGKTANPGTYFYTVELPDGDFKNGTIEVIKVK